MDGSGISSADVGAGRNSGERSGEELRGLKGDGVVVCRSIGDQLGVGEGEVY